MSEDNSNNNHLWTDDYNAIAHDVFGHSVTEQALDSFKNNSPMQFDLMMEMIVEYKHVNHINNNQTITNYISANPDQWYIQIEGWYKTHLAHEIFDRIMTPEGVDRYIADPANQEVFNKSMEMLMAYKNANNITNNSALTDYIAANLVDDKWLTELQTWATANSNHNSESLLHGFRDWFDRAHHDYTLALTADTSGNAAGGTAADSGGSATGSTGGGGPTTSGAAVTSGALDGTQAGVTSGGNSATTTTAPIYDPHQHYHGNSAFFDEALTLFAGVIPAETIVSSFNANQATSENYVKILKAYAEGNHITDMHQWILEEANGNANWFDGPKTWYEAHFNPDGTPIANSANSAPVLMNHPTATQATISAAEVAWRNKYFEFDGEFHRWDVKPAYLGLNIESLSQFTEAFINQTLPDPYPVSQFAQVARRNEAVQAYINTFWIDSVIDGESFRTLRAGYYQIDNYGDAIRDENGQLIPFNVPSQDEWVSQYLLDHPPQDSNLGSRGFDEQGHLRSGLNIGFFQSGQNPISIHIMNGAEMDARGITPTNIKLYEWTTGSDGVPFMYSKVEGSEAIAIIHGRYSLFVNPNDPNNHTIDEDKKRIFFNSLQNDEGFQLRGGEWFKGIKVNGNHVVMDKGRDSGGPLGSIFRALMRFDDFVLKTTLTTMTLGNDQAERVLLTPIAEPLEYIADHNPIGGVLGEQGEAGAVDLLSKILRAQGDEAAADQLIVQHADAMASQAAMMKIVGNVMSVIPVWGWIANAALQGKSMEIQARIADATGDWSNFDDAAMNGITNILVGYITSGITQYSGTAGSNLSPAQAAGLNAVIRAGLNGANPNEMASSFILGFIGVEYGQAGQMFVGAVRGAMADANHDGHADGFTGAAIGAFQGYLSANFGADHPYLIPLANFTVNVAAGMPENQAFELFATQILGNALQSRPGSGGNPGNQNGTNNDEIPGGMSPQESDAFWLANVDHMTPTAKEQFVLEYGGTIEFSNVSAPIYQSDGTIVMNSSSHGGARFEGREVVQTDGSMKIVGFIYADNLGTNTSRGEYVIPAYLDENGNLIATVGNDGVDQNGSAVQNQPGADVVNQFSGNSATETSVTIIRLAIAGANANPNNPDAVVIKYTDADGHLVSIDQPTSVTQLPSNYEMDVQNPNGSMTSYSVVDGKIKTIDQITFSGRNMHVSRTTLDGNGEPISTEEFDRTVGSPSVDTHQLGGGNNQANGVTGSAGLTNGPSTTLDTIVWNDSGNKISNVPTAIITSIGDIQVPSSDWAQRAANIYQMIYPGVPATDELLAKITQYVRTDNEKELIEHIQNGTPLTLVESGRFFAIGQATPPPGYRLARTDDQNVEVGITVDGTGRSINIVKIEVADGPYSSVEDINAALENGDNAALAGLFAMTLNNPALKATISRVMSAPGMGAAENILMRFTQGLVEAKDWRTLGTVYQALQELVVQNKVSLNYLNDFRQLALSNPETAQIAQRGLANPTLLGLIASGTIGFVAGTVIYNNSQTVQDAAGSILKLFLGDPDVAVANMLNGTQNDTRPAFYTQINSALNTISDVSGYTEVKWSMQLFSNVGADKAHEWLINARSEDLTAAQRGVYKTMIERSLGLTTPLSTDQLRNLERYSFGAYLGESDPAVGAAVLAFSPLYESAKAANHGVSYITGSQANWGAPFGLNIGPTSSRPSLPSIVLAAIGYYQGLAGSVPGNSRTGS